MARYRLTLYASTNPHFLTTRELTTRTDELWRAIVHAKRALMARRIISPERTLWDRWTLARYTPGQRLPSVVATGTASAVLWQETPPKSAT